jgi:molybdopterin molybdotransferase
MDAACSTHHTLIRASSTIARGGFMAPELIELELARGLVLQRATALAGEHVALRCALGRTLAEDVTSAEMVPGFDNSAMDGFAVRAGDTSDAGTDSPVRLRTADEASAGHPARLTLEPGRAIAIATGAMLPRGADAVVRIEDTHRAGAEIELRAPAERGQYVRFAGEDINAGDVVLRAGTAVGPFELGVLAAVGREQVPCVRRPSMRVLTTGDELVEPHEPLRPGEVRNANAYTVPALARLAGAQVLCVDTVGDAPDATAKALDKTLGCNVAIICGGVSVGTHDHVRSALHAAGVEQLFWGVALRPGKPTWFGIRAAVRLEARVAHRHHARGLPGEAGTLVFGLPGNPVSAIVTFLLFVRPALRVLCGADPERDRLTATLDEDYRKAPGRAHAVRCDLELHDDGWHARPTGPQGSHMLTSMLGAAGLGIVPTASEGIGAGERIEVELLPRAF